MNNLSTSSMEAHNHALLSNHKNSFAHLAEGLERNGVDVENVVRQLMELQIAIPSWALGAGGTRFGRFSIGGEPRSLEEKIEDIGLLHALTKSAGSVSLHIPWDIPTDITAIKDLAEQHNIRFDSVNSNTFQDQPNQTHSYKFGSLSHVHEAQRELAIAHNIEVIQIGNQLGSDSITVWLADGSCFPGQTNFRKALDWTSNSLQAIYQEMPEHWKMYIEYKPYEPNFYSTVIQDWGTSLMLAEGCGERAFTLVDLGHHLPNTNIEQIVSSLISKGRLGGFHFNDSKYGDDDLTVGSIKPYQLFLIFNELVWGMKYNTSNNPNLAWMIDASHNVKDPLEDLIQSLEAIRIAYAQALLVDEKALSNAQNESDVVLAQEILQSAFRTDVRPLLRQARWRSEGAIAPLSLYRSLDVRKNLIRQRGIKSVATGL